MGASPAQPQCQFLVSEPLRQESALQAQSKAGSLGLTFITTSLFSIARA